MILREKLKIFVCLWIYHLDHDGLRYAFTCRQLLYLCKVMVIQLLYRGTCQNLCSLKGKESLAWSVKNRSVLLALVFGVFFHIVSFLWLCFLACSSPVGSRWLRMKWLSISFSLMVIYDLSISKMLSIMLRSIIWSRWKWDWLLLFELSLEVLSLIIHC